MSDTTENEFDVSQDKYTVEFLIALPDHTWYSVTHVLTGDVVSCGEDIMVEWFLENHPEDLPEGAPGATAICVINYMTYEETFETED